MKKIVFSIKMKILDFERSNFFYIQGESKKTGISGVLADFGNFFFQNVMAANIIENFKIFEIF